MKRTKILKKKKKKREQKNSELKVGNNCTYQVLQRKITQMSRQSNRIFINEEFLSMQLPLVTS